MTDQVEALSRRQNIEQRRGKQAWKDIAEIKALSDEEQKEYRTLARGLNAMIQINGLGQTLGFLLAKSKSEDGKESRQGQNQGKGDGKGGKEPKKKAHYRLLVHLTQWMHMHFNSSIAVTDKSEHSGLLTWLLQEATSADYRRATTECLAFGTWLRRFAEAELKGDDPNASSIQVVQSQEGVS